MAKLTVRKSKRRLPSSKVKENHSLSAAPELPIAQSRPRPKPRPTGKGAKVARDSAILTNTSNTDQELHRVAETLVSLSTVTVAVPEAPIDRYCHAMFNIAPGVPLVTSSDLEDNEEDNDEIDQLDSDQDEDISNGMSNLLIELHSVVKARIDAFI